MEDELRIIISGGGTGGHIFPAISIANSIKAKRPDAKILFVGALGRMEMQRVPAAGYEIKGLPICGFDRKHPLRNIAVLFKIWKSQRMAKKIIREFRPMAAVGVGGYASGPTLNMCAAKHIPCLIQEQNSYAGVTNRLLAKKAEKICVAYEHMDRFFPADKIILTGNPVRQNLIETTLSRVSASTPPRRPYCSWAAASVPAPSTRACSSIWTWSESRACSSSGRPESTTATPLTSV